MSRLHTFKRILLLSCVFAGAILLLGARATYSQPKTVKPVAGDQLKPKCELTIEYWHQHCPGCEEVKQFLPGLQSKFPCVSIKTQVKSTPVPGGYPRAEQNGQTHSGPQAIKSLIESLAKQCGCGDAPRSGSCVCNKWTTGQRGYSCIPTDRLPEDIKGTLPGCDKVDECPMSYEECDKLPKPPGRCEILECLANRSPRCQIKPDTQSEDCDGTCSTVCGTGDPLVPTISPNGGQRMGGGPDKCVPNCNDTDCCSVPSCKGSEECKGVVGPHKVVDPEVTDPA